MHRTESPRRCRLESVRSGDRYAPLGPTRPLPVGPSVVGGATTEPANSLTSPAIVVEALATRCHFATMHKGACIRDACARRFRRRTGASVCARPVARKGSSRRKLGLPIALGERASPSLSAGAAHARPDWKHILLLRPPCPAEWRGGKLGPTPEPRRLTTRAGLPYSGSRSHRTTSVGTRRHKVAPRHGTGHRPEIAGTFRPCQSVHAASVHGQ